MQQTIFRSCGIKGVVNSDLLLDHVYKLGNAIAYYYLKHSNSVNTIIIGSDISQDSENIKEELIRAFVESGLNVISIGNCPIPVVQFALNVLPAQAAIYVNTYFDTAEYFNILPFIGTMPLVCGQISIIKSLYLQGMICKAAIQGTVRCYKMQNKYIDWLAQQFAMLNNCNYRVNIVCSNKLVEDLFKNLIQKLKLSAVSVSNEFLTDYKNNIPINIKLNELGTEIRLIKYGDCEISNDKLIAVFAQDISCENPDGLIVYDNMGTDCLECFFNIMNIKSYCVESGIYDLQSYLLKNNAVFGAEAKGCFYFRDKYFGFSDMFYTICRFYQLIYKDLSILDKMINMFLTMRCNQQLEIYS